LLSVRETAAILRVSEKTVRRRIRDGQLRTVRIAGLLRIEPAVLEDFIRDRRSH
jgi:excisionase family DNA binding protein